MKIHNHPQKDSYTNWQIEAPPIEFQSHWKPGNNNVIATPPMMTINPGLAHTHIAVTAPWWGELGNENVTIPLVFKMFQTDGAIVDIGAMYQGKTGEKEINDVNGNSRISIAQPYPYHINGNPAGLVQVPASLTFNLADGLDVGIPAHGWAAISIRVKVKYSNGDEVTTKAFIGNLFSVIDTSAPETPAGESGINLAVHAGPVVSARDTDTAFEAQLTEFKTLLPILAPFSNPQITDVFAYNYAPDIGLFPLTKYEMLLDPDFHMGIPGTVQPTRELGTTGNIDTWKPEVIAASMSPMGLPAGVHRLGFSWIVDTGNGFESEHGHMSAGERLVTLITFPITIGPNPDDNAPPTSWLVNEIPPVETCRDPRALNFGGPLPCIYAPPEEWHVITPIFKRNTKDEVCICDSADMKCLVLGTLIVDGDK